MFSGTHWGQKQALLEIHGFTTLSFPADMFTHSGREHPNIQILGKMSIQTLCRISKNKTTTKEIGKRMQSSQSYFFHVYLQVFFASTCEYTTVAIKDEGVCLKCMIHSVAAEAILVHQSNGFSTVLNCSFLNESFYATNFIIRDVPENEPKTRKSSLGPKHPTYHRFWDSNGSIFRDKAQKMAA